MSLIGAYEGVGIVGIVVALVAPDPTAVQLVTTDTTVSFSLTLIHACTNIQSINQTSHTILN